MTSWLPPTRKLIHQRSRSFLILETWIVPPFLFIVSFLTKCFFNKVLELFKDHLPLCFTFLAWPYLRKKIANKSLLSIPIGGHLSRLLAKGTISLNVWRIYERKSWSCLSLILQLSEHLTLRLEWLPNLLAQSLNTWVRVASSGTEVLLHLLLKFLVIWLCFLGNQTRVDLVLRWWESALCRVAFELILHHNLRTIDEEEVLY